MVTLSAIALGVLIVLILLSRLQERPATSVGSGPEPAATDVQGQIDAGNMIGAIKAYRLKHGASLKDAKEAVEAMAQGKPVTPPSRPAPVDQEDVKALIRAGKKIEAIKVYRESTGEGLKEAKDAVEAIAKEMGL